MISQEKWKILTPLYKLPKNVRDLGKLIVAKGFKKLPKVQKIAQSGHTVGELKEVSSRKKRHGETRGKDSLIFVCGQRAE